MLKQQQWKGKFTESLSATQEVLNTEVKGLDKKKKAAKPDTTKVKKTIEKTVKAEKIPASKTERLLKQVLVEKQFALIFGENDEDADLRKIYALRTLFGPALSEVDFKEAAVMAKIHLDNTYGIYKASSGRDFPANKALAPFGTGEVLSERENATAVLYMWFLYGEDKDIARTLFGDIISRERASTDLADFVGAKDVAYDGNTLADAVSKFDEWRENVLCHSLDSIEAVLRSASSRFVLELVNYVFSLNLERESLGVQTNALMVLLQANKLPQTLEEQSLAMELYELEKKLSKTVLRNASVGVVRRLYVKYNLPKYWLAIIKEQVAEESISSDNLIYLVSELQQRRVLSEDEEKELTDAAALLELTKKLDNTEITERQGGFTFR